MDKNGLFGKFLQHMSCSRYSYTETLGCIIGSTLYGSGSIGMLGMALIMLSGVMTTMLIRGSLK